ncbi:MAG: Ig-like domain-containing protein [Patescibacteria group bacterium]
MTALTTQIDVRQKIATHTKLTIIIGLITAGFVGLSLFSNAFLAGPIARDIPPTDAYPPAISLQTPITDRMISGIVVLSFSLMDYSGISQATLSVDGQTHYIINTPNSRWNYLFNTTTLATGEHQLAVTATDKAGNTTAMKPISFIVAN